MRRLVYTVDSEDDGRQLLYVLRSRLGISKRLLKRLKRDERGILLNDVRKTVRAVVHTGDVLSVAMSPTRETSLIAEERPLEVLYEDEDLLLCRKPRGVTMYPRYRGEPGAFSGAVMHHLQAQTSNTGFYPLYRLDKGTGGMVLLAKSSHIAHWMQKRPPQKIYQALVFGIVAETGRLSLPLEVAPEGWRSTGALFWPASEGKASCTCFERLFADEKNGVSGVMVHLPTGRRHQIRVHFAHAGHPLMGDTAYGGPEVIQKAPMLHVGCLQFRRPSDRERLTFFDPMADCPPIWLDYFAKEGIHLDYLARCVQERIDTTE